MRWNTEIELPDLPIEITHSTAMTTIGSCFSDEIGHRLDTALFDIAVNPLGTLFNPLSIADAINDAIDNREFNPDELFCVDGTWRTLRRHSRFALPDRNATMKMLSATQSELANRLKTSDLLIVTFGSAIAHVHKPTGRVAANCHKLPASTFDIKEISVAQIASVWKALINKLLSQNPALQILITVSPVRHIGYGLQADRLSKSRLIVAAHDLASKFPQVNYFPAYEAVVDDLRDYRFYAEDLVHPASTAVDYVYDLLCRSTMSTATRDLAVRCEKLTRAAGHRSSTADSANALRTSLLQRAAMLNPAEPNLLINRFKSYLTRNDL